MKPVEWKTYRTRFLIKAKQLSSSFSFVDHLGREHCGRKGDYLVESSEGVLSIAPRRVFEDIYVLMSTGGGPHWNSQMPNNDRPNDDRSIDQFFIEPLNIEELEISQVVRPRRSPDARQDRHNDAARVRRKLPQPCRDRRTPSSRFILM